MGQMVSATNSDSGADIRSRRTERDMPIYLHVAESTGESRWYSIEDEAGQVQDVDDEDDDDHRDPILLMEGKAYSRTTDRLRRVQVPSGLSCNNRLYQYGCRHVVLNDTIYALGAKEYRCFNLLEKQQTSSSSESSSSSELEQQQTSSSEEVPNNCAEMVKHRSNLISEFSQINEFIKKISEICSEWDYQLDWAVNNWKVDRLVVSRTARSPLKVRLEGFKLFPIWPRPPSPSPSPSEESDYSGWQCSAVGFDNGWIYALGLVNWSLEVHSGKCLDLPKPELPHSTICNEHDFCLLGATKTKLFAYFRDASVGDKLTNILFCLDLERSQSQSQRWQWQAIDKVPWRGQFSAGVVREYDNGDSYLFCCGCSQGHRVPPALHVFDIKNGMWLKGRVEGDLFFPFSTCIPFLVDIGHQKLAAVWYQISDNFIEVHWCKFTIINAWSDGRKPTFCTQLVSRGARRVLPGSIVDCTPAIPLIMGDHCDEECPTPHVSLPYEAVVVQVHEDHKCDVCDSLFMDRVQLKSHVEYSHSNHVFCSKEKCKNPIIPKAQVKNHECL